MWTGCLRKRSARNQTTCARIYLGEIRDKNPRQKYDKKISKKVLTFWGANSILIKSVAVAADEYGILAQLGEHLPYKQRVIGSSPIGPIL